MPENHKTEIKVTSITASRRLFHTRGDLHGVCARIATMAGIESVQPHRYYLDIEKANLYSWDEIEPKVVELLGKIVKQGA